MGVKGLRYQDTTKIDNRINSKLSYQQCSGRQEKSFQDYYLCLFIEFVLSKPGDSFKPFKKPEFIIAVENGQLMVKVSPCYH